MDARAELKLRIFAQLKLVAAARQVQAIEAHFMSDRVAAAGLTLYRPTLAHTWCFMEMERLKLWRTRSEQLQLLGYGLTHSPPDVRNVLLRRLQVDPQAVKADADALFRDHPEALAVADTLMDDLRTDGNDGDDGGDDIGLGWWSRIIHKIALNYHWSEEQIFAVPLARLLAYSREITEHHGGTVVRHVAKLPEEIELGRLMRLQKEMTQNGRQEKNAGNRDQGPGRRGDQQG